MKRVTIGVFLAILAVAGVSHAFVGEIPEDLAVRALIGEAGGQSDAELYAHACALLNRGTLQGVYGIYSKNAQNSTQGQINRATRAWQLAQVSNNDVTNGRTEWRSDYDLKLMAKKGRTPAGQGLYDGLKIGQTTFYRLKGKR